MEIKVPLTINLQMDEKDASVVEIYGHIYCLVL